MQPVDNPRISLISGARAGWLVACALALAAVETPQPIAETWPPRAPEDNRQPGVHDCPLVARPADIRRYQEIRTLYPGATAIAPEARPVRDLAAALAQLEPRLRQYDFALTRADPDRVLPAYRPGMLPGDEQPPDEADLGALENRWQRGERITAARVLSVACRALAAPDQGRLGDHLVAACRLALATDCDAAPGFAALALSAHGGQRWTEGHERLMVAAWIAERAGAGSYMDFRADLLAGRAGSDRLAAVRRLLAWMGRTPQPRAAAWVAAAAAADPVATFLAAQGSTAGPRPADLPGAAEARPAAGLAAFLAFLTAADRAAWLAQADATARNGALAEALAILGHQHSLCTELARWLAGEGAGVTASVRPQSYIYLGVATADRIGPEAEARLRRLRALPIYWYAQYQALAAARGGAAGGHDRFNGMEAVIYAARALELEPWGGLAAAGQALIERGNVSVQMGFDPGDILVFPATFGHRLQALEAMWTLYWAAGRRDLLLSRAASAADRHISDAGRARAGVQLLRFAALVEPTPAMQAWAADRMRAIDDAVQPDLRFADGWAMLCSYPAAEACWLAGRGQDGARFRQAAQAIAARAVARAPALAQDFAELAAKHQGNRP